MPTRGSRATLHRTKMQIVYEHMKDTIVRGKWKAGERRNASEIAEELGVSRTPVIDASHLLVREGYLKVLPQVGLEATQLSPREVEEVFLIRGALMGLATAEASRQIQGGDLRRLEDLLVEMKVAGKARSVDEFVGLNRKFHQIIYQACGLPGLIAEIERFWSNSSRFNQILRNLPPFYDSSVRRHEAILEALRNRDYARAKTEAELDTVDFGRAVAEFLRRSVAGECSTAA
jgi:DNA-binding GntR family transcriptional regulator